MTQYSHTSTDVEIAVKIVICLLISIIFHYTILKFPRKSLVLSVIFISMPTEQKRDLKQHYTDKGYWGQSSGMQWLCITQLRVGISNKIH